MIDQLPDLALYRMLSYLNCEEQIRLKAVCRRLNYLVTYHLTERTWRLFVYRDYIYSNETWGWPDQPIKRKECIPLKLFLQCLTGGYFKNLKILFFSSCNFHCRRTPIYEEFHQESLVNCLGKLDKLFITNFTASSLLSSHPESIFNLPGLKSFSIKELNNWNHKLLKIQSQCLERLAIWNQHFEISLSNPERVEYIECERFSKSLQEHAFPNLSELKCANLPASFDISKYPKLRRLLFCPGEHYEGGAQFENEFHLVDSLMRQRKQLERFDLEILVSGFKALTDRPFAIRSLDENEIHLTVERLERLKENFSNFVGPIPWYTQVDFPGSIEMATNLSRYLTGFNISEVLLEGEFNADLAIKFLQEIHGINTLAISNCPFDLTFYDRLSSVPFICCLEISNPVIDCFDFICSIKMLQYLELSRCPLPIDHLEQLIERSKVSSFYLSAWIPRFQLIVNKNESHKFIRLHYRKKKDSSLIQKRIFETVQEGIAFMKSFETIREQLV